MTATVSRAWQSLWRIRERERCHQRRRAGRPAAAALLIAWVAAATLWLPGTARALLGDSRGPAGLDGSLRVVAVATDGPESASLLGGDDSAFLSQTLLRLTLAGRPRDFVSYELHVVQTVDTTSASATLGQGGLGASVPYAPAPSDARYRALDATWDWLEESDTGAALILDRASASFHLASADITLGRQAITFGKAFFWNPLDVFLPFDPRQFDREYKAGVDAARVDIHLGPFSGINLIAAAGRTMAPTATTDDGELLDSSWFGSALLARAFTTLHGWDLAAQGGKVYGGYQLGAGATGELGPLALRLEAAFLDADDSPPLLAGVFPASEKLVEDGLSTVVGIGHRFDNSLSLDCEYFYNGARDPHDLQTSFTRLATGGLLAASEHLGGFVATYEFMPILFGNLAWMVSFNDGSGQIQPGLTWWASDEIGVQAGAIISYGSSPAVGLHDSVLRSEFGTSPHIFYIEPKIYF